MQVYLRCGCGRENEGKKDSGVAGLISGGRGRAAVNAPNCGRSLSIEEESRRETGRAGGRRESDGDGRVIAGMSVHCEGAVLGWGEGDGEREGEGRREEK